jgi:hypothetical protein
MTEKEFIQALPRKCKKSINMEIIKRVNEAMADPEFYESYRENLLSYGRVMADGRFQVPKYLDAVKYVSFKMMGKSNKDAYAMTFPNKMIRFNANGATDKDVSSYTTTYNKSKLVALIYEQTMVPSWILNQDMYQKALNTQAELMISARSEKVRADAANSLLTHLKQPESQKVELSVGITEDSSIQMLREATLALAAKQRQSIQAGQYDAQEVAHSPVVIDQEEA